MEEEGDLTDQEPVVSASFLNSALNCLQSVLYFIADIITVMMDLWMKCKPNDTGLKD